MIFQGGGENSILFLLNINIFLEYNSGHSYASQEC